MEPTPETKQEDKKAEPKDSAPQSTPKVPAAVPTETVAPKKEDDRGKSPDSGSGPAIKTKKSVQFTKKGDEEPSPPDIP